MKAKAFIILWLIGAVALFLYSYTQIDLSLTLSQASFIKDIQTSFQYVGWFNRPLSTYLYVGLLVYLFSLFIITIRLISKKTLSTKSLWVIVISLAIILFPSYNAFSYDLFNYIFDARIVSFYGLNPYEYKPLDFASDPMLSFMRSTHRVYPYGPSWLGLTVPLTFIANEVFFIAFFLFKFLSAVCFIGTAYFIWKTAKKINLNSNLSLALFALNPLVLIESLVSSHNEIVMMFFAILAIYLIFIKRNALSIVSLAISIGVKYATVIFAPVFIIKFFYKKITDEKLMIFALALSVLAVVITSIASGQNKNPEFQPWYLLLAAPFISLHESNLIRFIFIFVSFASLLSYIPYLYVGMWPENIVMLKNVLIIFGGITGVVSYFILNKSK